MRNHLREKYPDCFFVRKKLPSGIKLRVVTADIEQLVYKIPGFVRDRGGVYGHVMKYLRSAAMEAVNSLDPVEDAGDVVHVYGLFDTGDSVTPAKEMCQQKRYRYSRAAPPDAAEQLRRFEADEQVSCTWQEFVSYSPGRRALLRYLATELQGAPADMFGDRIVLHVGDAGPIGEAELKQQAIAVRDARLGVMCDSVDSDLVLALLLAMRSVEPTEIGELPTIVIRSTFYVGRKDGDDTRPLTEAGPIAVDDDDDFLGPPPDGNADDDDPPEVRDAIDGFVRTAKPVPGAAPAPTPAPAPARRGNMFGWLTPRSDGAGTSAAAAAATPAAKSKRVPVREYVLINELWRAMRSDCDGMPETLAFIAFLMGSDLVPGTGGGGSPVPYIGGKYAWDVWCEVGAGLGTLVRQVPVRGNRLDDDDVAEEKDVAPADVDTDADTEPDEPGRPEQRSTSAVREFGSVRYDHEYRIDWRVFVLWLRAVYAKKFAGKLDFGTDPAGAVLPAWAGLVEATEGAEAAAPAPNSRKPRVLDLQWALQVGLLARYAINYYGMGILTRDPFAKDDEGMSLCGWCQLRGQTRTALDADEYSPYSRWSRSAGGVPGLSDLHVSGADAAYGYGAEHVLLRPAPTWTAGKGRKRPRAAPAARAKKIGGPSVAKAKRKVAAAPAPKKHQISSKAAAVAAAAAIDEETDDEPPRPKKRCQSPGFESDGSEGSGIDLW